MKTVIVGSCAFDSLEYHLADSVRALGGQALIIDGAGQYTLARKAHYWASRFVESYDRAMCTQLARRVATERPDLVLVVYRHLHPVFVDVVKQLLPGATVAQVNPDALSNLEKQQIIAADFDHYFTKEPYIAEFLRDKAGLNAHYLPEGFNPRLHRRPDLDKADAEQQTNIDVLLYGGLYAYRARMVGQLQQAGIRVTVFGSEGPYLPTSVRAAFLGRYLVGDEKNRLLYGARIVFNNFHYAEISSANQKYFEINGIGAFQLCDYKATLDEYSGVPAERVTYRTITEAIDMIRYYLARPAERHALAASQHAHFQQHHTFDQRVGQLLRITGHSLPPSYEDRPVR
ncbi:spore maturation protein CgeB [Spirosoma oryzae]|uniref:Spore maturation protein CgeB n=1 Tax=Spirosoma oryzae TaxID=1469603 RepID=A0A2T0T8T3_9BACT|nr:glycosyltransferase [Spirosoma oryzae]PRY42048.1 spore maturation protein CgeB [Spirosoma oryzae]